MQRDTLKEMTDSQYKKREQMHTISKAELRDYAKFTSDIVKSNYQFTYEKFVQEEYSEYFV